MRHLLRVYFPAHPPGIPWSASFDTDDIPDLVVAAAYKSSIDCNYAVCYGVRIVLPTYLDNLLARLEACWRRIADSQDSFTLPDAASSDFQPNLDSGLPNLRSEIRCWLPDRGRRELWKGWTVMGLKGKTVR